jgi:hypothetical protein
VSRGTLLPGQYFSIIAYYRKLSSNIKTKKMAVFWRF